MKLTADEIIFLMFGILCFAGIIAWLLNAFFDWLYDDTTGWKS